MSADQQQQLFDVRTWRDRDDTEQPPPYEKNERLPPSYHDIKRADRDAASGWKGAMRRMFPAERRFETVTLGGASHQHTTGTARLG